MTGNPFVIRGSITVCFLCNYQNAKSLSAETQVKAGNVTMARNNVNTDFTHRQKLCILLLNVQWKIKRKSLPLNKLLGFVVLDISNSGVFGTRIVCMIMLLKTFLIHRLKKQFKQRSLILVFTIYTNDTIFTNDVQYMCIKKRFD